LGPLVVILCNLNTGFLRLTITIFAVALNEIIVLSVCAYILLCKERLYVREVSI